MLSVLEMKGASPWCECFGVNALDASNLNYIWLKFRCDDQVGDASVAAAEKEKQVERMGLTPDWIIQATAFKVFRLPPPTPEQPFIRGLLDPCTNSLLAPNIPAEKLYDKVASTCCVHAVCMQWPVTPQAGLLTEHHVSQLQQIFCQCSMQRKHLCLLLCCEIKSSMHV